MRKFTIVDCLQGSPEWFKARVGKMTGSRAPDMMATLKSDKEAAARRDLRVQLVCERLTNEPQDDNFVNADMRRGTELEPDARFEYEAATGFVVHTSGFLSHLELPCGASLDGHVGDFDSIVELKVPRPATHLRYVRAGGLPSEHKYQVLHNLFISGASFADFVSFAPSFPPSLRLFRVRVERNQTEIDAYELALRLFLSEVERECAELAKLAGVAA